MQTKKRAKPVKFGKDAKKPVKKDPVKEVPDEVKLEEPEESKVEEPKTDKKSVVEKEAGKGSDDAQAAKVEEVEDSELYDEKTDKENVDSAKGDQEMVDAETKGDDWGESLENDSLDTEEKDDDGDEDLGSDEYFSKPPESYDKKKGIFGYFMKVVIITFLIAIALFAGGYYAYINQDKLLSFVTSPSPTPTEPPASSPTAEPVDLAEFSIRVLNGTDTAGLAGDTKALLEEAGFSVISVGNAESDDFEETEIATVKSVDKAFLDKLKEELAKNYVLGETTKLSTGEADIIITIGSASAK